MSDNQPTTTEFRVYPKRYLVVGLFCLIQMMTAILINTLTPIAKSLQTLYGQPAIVVNSGSLLFALMHPLFTFPASYVIDTFGTRVGISIGSALCLLGTSMRMLVNQSFGWVIAGQVIAGIGRPFILNCQAKISANWFTAQKRGSVTQLLTLVLNVSLIVGLFVPSLVFGKYDVNIDTVANHEKGKQLTFDLMLVETVMAAICYIPNILLQDSKPPTPPSNSGNLQRQQFKKAIPSLFKKRNYVLLLIGFGCYFGIFNAISLTLSFLLHPWFAKNITFAVSIVGGSPVISGIIGVIVFSPLQRKSKQFKKWIVICMLGSVTAIILFYPLLLANSLAIASLISAINSFFLIPLVPIMIELSCEIAFPVGEGSAVGLLFAVGNFGAFFFGIIMTIIVKGEEKMETLAGLAFCLLVFLLGFMAVWRMKEEKNREDYEEERSKDSLRDSTITAGEQTEEGTKEPLLAQPK